MQLVFTVTDTGIGIPEEKMNRLFESFSQIDGSYTRKYGGTGLGLAISKSLINLMDGDISVKSKIGVGSTFAFTIRVEKDKSTEQSNAFIPSELKGKKALVIDDNKTNLLILKRILQYRGMDVTTALTGTEGMGIVKDWSKKRKDFDLIIVDYKMQGITGIEFVQRIKEEGYLKESKILLLTSLDIQGGIKYCKEMGISNYLLKPVKRNDLYDAIIRLFQEKGGEIEVKEHGNKEMGEGEGVENKCCQREKGRVLLAEDNYINQKLAILMLEKGGYQVTAVSNGKEAVEAIEKDKYDIVLMDIQMNVMDGLEATSIIRRNEKEGKRRIPIIAMTAYAMEEDKKKFISSGMDGYISKPINMQELYEIIETFIKRIQVERKQEVKEIADLTGIEKIMGGEPRAIEDLIDTFLSTYPKQLKDIFTEITKRNTEEIYKKSHAFRGGASNFRIHRACDLALQLERESKQGNINKTMAIFVELSEEMDKVKQCLIDYKKTL